MDSDHTGRVISLYPHNLPDGWKYFEDYGHALQIAQREGMRHFASFVSRADEVAQK